MDLVFDGLDGQAQVFLNGKLILTADNSFRVWRVDAKSALHAGKEFVVGQLCIADYSGGRSCGEGSVASEDEG